MIHQLTQAVRSVRIPLMKKKPATTDRHKAKSLPVRFSDEDRERFEQAMKVDGDDKLTTWIRRTLRKRADEILGRSARSDAT